MSKIFISHSSRDNFEAVALRDWLARAGWADVFLDLDPDRGIAPGARWERELHEAALRCEAVIFLVSANWLASDWCFKEYTLARTLNKKLFAVVVDPTKPIAELPPALKDTWQAVDLAGGQDGELLKTLLPGSHEEKHVVFSRDGLRRLKRGLEAAGLDPKFFVWPPENEPTRAPYRGLKPLESADAGVFFGREAPIIEATDRLRGLRAAAPPRLMAILGASGAGKSSFLRAGLLPRLARDDRNFLPLPAIRPERAALTGENGLLGALESLLPNRTRPDIRAAIHAGAAALRPLLAELLDTSLRGTLAEDRAAKPPIIVVPIDQAEELFRPEGAAEGEALLALLRDLTTEDSPAVIAIFAIRSDSYDALEHAKPLEGLPQATLPLLPMPRGAYKDVIEGPARRYAEAGAALAIEPQLTQRLLEDIDKGGGSDALPLLAFTLEQLFLDYRRTGALRLRNYEDFGGLKGAIDAAVERAFRRADADPRIPRERKAREALLRRGLIPWLAGVDPDSKSPRRAIARRSEIPEEAAPLIDLLVEERLLSTDTAPAKDAATGVESRLVTIEPAHEALLRQWGLLQGWLAEDFGLLATLEGVQRASRDWEANGRAEAWLAHQGQRLAEALGLDARPDIAAKLGAGDRAYLADCRAKEDAAQAEAEARRREREEEQARKLADAEAIAAAKQRVASRTRVGLVAALALAVVAAGFGFYAWREKAIAVDQTREAELQRDAADAAKTVAVERESEARRNQVAALAALSSAALGANPARAAKLALSAWPRRLADLSPKLGVAMGALGAAVPELRERAILRGHDDKVSSAAFSPDGRRVVTASFDKTARLWDGATGKEIAVLSGHENWVNGAAFSPDGRRVVTVSFDKTARLWDAATGAPIAVLSGHDATVWSAAFSPDGRRVVTASWDKTARLWDAATGAPIAVLRGHEAIVLSAAFSPDGTRVVTASEDKTARLWDAATGKEIAVLSGHESWVNGAAFSPDGTRLVTASSDATARLWDAATGVQSFVLRGHKDKVLSAAFSPDGTRVVTASEDKTARLWNAATGAPIADLRGHDGFVTSAAFSPEGTRILTASDDKTARLWDATGKDIAVLRGHEAIVWSAAFSPDGARVVTASDDKTARLWDVATGREVAALSGHAAAVLDAVFSPDGTRVVTASEDRTARIWDWATGRPTVVLGGHEDAVNSAAFSPDGTRVVTASNDKTARLWEAATGKEIAVLSGHDGFVSSAAFSPDGTRVVTASRDGTARLWNGATGAPIAVLRGRDGSLLSAAFSADGTRIVTASSLTAARVWDAATGQEIAELGGGRHVLWSAAFSPDGTRVVTASWDHTARVWDAATGEEIPGLGGSAPPVFVAVLRGHDDVVRDAAFSPDGMRLVTASEDKTARLWDAATGAPIIVLRGHDKAVNSAAFSPDGRRVVTASYDGTARIWDVSSIPKGDIFQIACAWLPDHDLTDIARDYGLTNLDPICEGDPPRPDPPAP